jgi:succinate-acetate transporter protein
MPTLTLVGCVEGVHGGRNRSNSGSCPRTNLVLVAAFAAVTLTFVFVALGFYNASMDRTKIGYLGLLTALLAWYGSLAGVMNATAGRVVFPVFPR